PQEPLLGPDADHRAEYEDRASDAQPDPVAESEVGRDELAEHRRIDRVPDQTVWAICHQLVVLDDARRVAPLPAQRADGGQPHPSRGRRDDGREEVERDLGGRERRAGRRRAPLEHPDERVRDHLDGDAELRGGGAPRGGPARAPGLAEEEDEEPEVADGDEDAGDERERGDRIETHVRADPPREPKEAKSKEATCPRVRPLLRYAL